MFVDDPFWCLAKSDNMESALNPSRPWVQAVGARLLTPDATSAAPVLPFREPCRGWRGAAGSLVATDGKMLLQKEKMLLQEEDVVNFAACEAETARKQMRKMEKQPAQDVCNRRCADQGWIGECRAGLERNAKSRDLAAPD
jgi:hypothetical protein